MPLPLSKPESTVTVAAAEACTNCSHSAYVKGQGMILMDRWMVGFIRDLYHWRSGEHVLNRALYKKSILLGP
jgi:hypothetical protein